MGVGGVEGAWLLVEEWYVVSREVVDVEETRLEGWLPMILAN